MSNYNSGQYYGPYKYNEGLNLEELDPSELDIYIDAGDSYAKDFSIKDEYGVPINLSGLDIAATMHRYYGSGTSYALVPTITDATLGKVRMTMTAAESAKLKNPRYVYEVRVYDTYSTTRIVYGQALITQMV